MLGCQHKAYIAYLTAGLGQTVEAALAIIDGGADILEIGVPFSDPILDGPVIAQAMQLALEKKTTLLDTLAFIQQIKQKRNTPLILFSYYNPIKVLGESFYPRAVEAGVDATLIVDLPLQEQQQHLHYSRQYHLAHIQLLAPNSTPENIRAADKTGPAFHYYACRAGTTGVQSALPEDFAERMQFIRRHTTAPVVAGFGISNAIMAKASLQHADGFVVGSRLVQAMLAGCTLAELKTLTSQMRQ